MPPVTARRAGHRPPIRLAHFAMRLFYALAGLAAVVSTYTRLRTVLDDPVVATMMTLVAVMAFMVVAMPTTCRR
jgi:hypothetical protein